MNAGMPPPHLSGRGVSLFIAGWVVICAVSLFSSSCISVFSSRSGAASSGESAASGGLIKPKLQDKDMPAPKTMAEDKSKESRPRTTTQGSGVGTPGVWDRLFGLVTGAKTSKDAGSSPGLIKPKLGELTDKEAGSNKRVGEPAQSVPSTEKALLTQAAAQEKDRAPDSLPSKSKETGMLESPLPDKAASEDKGRSPARDARANKDQPPPVGEKETKREKPPADGQEIETVFKKHDHVKYVTMIRNKAIDALNKEPDCDLARLCRDSFTDGWSLTLYKKSGKYYTYTVYAWDEIDGNWVASYASEKRPLANMKKHLSFSSSGKTCQTLKGSEHGGSF
ncbi:MAG: hypothetical protein ACP5M0_13675 [Desulfomonilaceae bacterium]